MTKRTNISLLPVRHQTDSLKRLFASTVDQATQPGNAETISGFIGRHPSYFNPAKDFYKAEPSLLRETYQLEPVMTSVAADGSISAAMFYDDLLRQLATEGANVDSAERLLETDSWSWAPPVDIDKLTNFKQYYWVKDTDPKLILTAPRHEYVANSSRTVFPIPTGHPSLDASHDNIIVLIDENRTTDYTRVGENVVFASAPMVGTKVTVFRYGNIFDALNGQTDFPIEIFGVSEAEFTSTARMSFDDAVDFATGYGTSDWRSETWLSDLPTYFFDGKATGFTFTPDEGSQLAPFYVCCDRRSKDRSPWARYNRWVHRDTIIAAGLATSERQAKRPIIEFIPDIRLWKYGFNRLPDITATITGSPYDRVGHADIAITDIVGRAAGTVESDGGHILVAGDRVLIRGTSTYANTIRTVSVVGGLYRFDGTTAPEYGDIVRLFIRGIVPFDETTFEAEAYEFNENSLEFYFDGVEWAEAQTFSSEPLFELYDQDKVCLSDSGIYPDSTFAGSRIFGYSSGSTVDETLGLSIDFDKFSQIVFENDISTRTYSYRDGDIIGYYFYKTGSEESEFYSNAWHLVSGPLVSPSRNGLPEIPINLQANPDFEEPSFISRNQWFDHFSSIIENQEGFSGQPFSDSNWRDTARALNVGTFILQHRAPLLKTMLLASDATFSVVDAIRFVQAEYVRFRNKFIQSIVDLSNEGELSTDNDPTEWVDAALRRLSSSKSAEFAFSLSTLAGGQWFIPPTPTAMGLYHSTVPAMVTDSSFGAAVTFLRGHDGSLTPSFGDFRDTVMLSLETKIYEALVDRFRTSAPAFQIRDHVHGKFQSETEYSYRFDELTAIESPMLENWAKANNLNFRDNSGFDVDDYFTWNFSTATDHSGARVPGNWRAIYRWYFDTDRPHLAPWEMLGFADMPSWWIDVYGESFGTSNTLMWGHIEAGYVAAPQPYTLSKLARPGLMQFLPVTEDGELLDPYTARIIPKLPTAQDGARGWMAGDGSPVEALWRRSVSYPFDVMVASYLMKPVRFVEDGWDTDDREFVIGEQWVNTSVRRRLRHGELSIHGEFIDGVYVVKNGVQQFVIEAMASRGQSASIVGTAVRGLTPRIAHKMAGFTTGTGLRLATENFGLIPQEDISVRLYRSPPQRSEFYSGIVIEKQEDGWRVLGYDQQNPYFTVLPPISSSRATYLSNSPPPPAVNRWQPNARYTNSSYAEFGSTIYKALEAHTSSTVFDAKLWDVAPEVQRLIDNYGSRVKKYTQYSDTPIRVPYGAVLASNQELANLMLGHEAYMKSRGWVFDRLDDGKTEPQDWSASILDFLSWSEERWAVGNFIALSPFADRALFKSDHGIVLEIDQKHGLVDKVGRPIIQRDVQIDRMDDEVSIAARDTSLFGVRVRIAEIEHVLILSNVTIFNDVIYQPLYNLRQPRVKMSAMRTTNWNGRLDAPGYIISGNDLLPNFDRAAENIRSMFDIERAGDATLRDHARHLIGYQSREYLSALGLPETQQFELYQGMIQSKGTIGAFDKLLRSDTLVRETIPKVLEEWAFRIGSFGALLKRASMTFSLRYSDVRRQPQFINFRPGPVVRDDWVQFGVNDDRWIDQPPNLFSLLPAATPPSAASLPISAYVKPIEIQHTVFNFSGVSDLINAGTEIAAGDSILVHDTGLGKWTTFVIRNASPTAGENRIIRMETSLDDAAIIGTRLVMASPHGLSGDVVGMPILVNGTFPIAPDVSGVRTILSITTNTIEIDDLIEEGFDFDEADTDGPLVLQFVKTRFSNIIARDLAMAFVQPGEIAYVDDAGFGTWATYTRTSTGWENARRAPRRVDTTKIASSAIYNLKTAITTTRISPSPLLLDGIAVIDPSAGLIAGAAERELDYKLEYDPAVYDDSNPWKEHRVGRLWWDLSTVRFINCHTDEVFDLPTDDPRYLSEMEHRIANWGQIAPASSVDVYEWTRSNLPPSDWIVASANNTTTAYQGAPYGGADGPFREEAVIDPATGVSKSVYYFWVKGRKSIPKSRGRKLDAYSIERILANPSGEDIAWLAPIAPDGMLVAGMDTYLDDFGSALRIETTLTDYQGKDHSQWMLMRPTDEQSLPPRTLWNKLGSSLVGFNTTLREVPDPSLHQSEANGIGEAPLQSIFPTRDARLAGRKSFVTMVNYILGRSNLTNTRASALAGLYRETPLPTRLTWTQADGSNIVEPVPPSLEWDNRRAYTPQQRDEILLGDEFVFALGAVPYDNAEGFEYYTYDFDDSLVTSRPRILLDLTSSARPQWSVWEINPDATAPSSIADMISRPNDFLIPALTYDREVASLAARDALITSINAPIVAGDRVLVRGTTETSGFWTIWKYDPSVTTENSGFILVNAQTYRTSDFFDFADWYAEGYDASSGPAVRYATVSDFTNGENPVTNSFVMVDDDGSGAWEWLAYNGNSWEVVAHENGTIQLSDKFYEPTRLAYGWANSEIAIDLSMIDNRDGSLEFRMLFDLLRDSGTLTDAETNELWFSMIHHIFSTQDQVDWAVKTSFLSLGGYNEPMRPSPVSSPDNTAALLSYFEEVKPYRVKIRDSIRRLAPDVDSGSFSGEEISRDFDIDMIFDRVAATGAPDARLAQSLDITDIEIVLVEQVGNPLPTPTSEFSPVIFVEGERITYTTITPDGDYTRLSGLTRAFAPSFHEQGASIFIGDLDLLSATARILAFYTPSPGMVDKSLSDLLNIQFKGTIIDGGTMTAMISNYDVGGFDELLFGDDEDIEYDTNVIGSDETAPLNINPTTNGVPSYRLADPYHSADRPPELASLMGSDSLRMTVSEEWSTGGVPQEILVFDTIKRRSATTTLNFSLIPQSKDAVIVYRDGLRASPADVTVGINSVTVNLTKPGARRVSTVIVHVWGSASATRIRSRVLSGAGVASIAISNSENASIEVIADGVSPSVAPTITNGIVTLASPPSAYAMVTIHEPGSSQTPSQKVRSDVLSWNTNQTWTLNNPARDNFYPEHCVTHVEVNGLRLTPPTTVEITTPSRFIEFENVILDRTKVEIAENGNAPTGQLPITGSWTTLADALAATVAGEKFAIFGRYLIRLNGASFGYGTKATVRENSDYFMPSAGNLTITKTLFSTDQIVVTTMANARYSDFSTQVFNGNPAGTYSCPRCYDPATIWLTVNGERMIYGRHFGVEAGVIRMDGHLAADRVVISYARNRSAPEPRQFQIATSFPDVSRYVRNGGGFEQIKTAWETASLDFDRHSGRLSQAVNVGDNTIVIDTVTIIPASLRETSVIPTPIEDRPGVIWIDHERIEYYAISQVGSIVTLSELRRGTRGTSAGLIHKAGTRVIAPTVE